MISKTVKQIQQALMDQGCSPGGIDGIWGRNTIEAVKQFQKIHGLVVDGVVGQQTMSALFKKGTVSTFLPWFEEAQHLMGTKEILGDKSNPVILDWAKDLDISYAGDDVAWCGLFVAHCIGLTIPQEVLPGNPLGARQWENFGNKINPCLGAVMVFWRKSLTSGLGHVGFYVGENDSEYQILGGNQSNEVCLIWINKDRFLSAHWPKMASILKSSAVYKDKDLTEKYSINEA